MVEGLELEARELDKFRNGTADPFLGSALGDWSSSQYSISHSSGIAGLYLLFSCFLTFTLGLAAENRDRKRVKILESFHFLLIKRKDHLDSTCSFA